VQTLLSNWRKTLTPSSPSAMPQCAGCKGG
jgi:hypothetical protein